jgi:methylglutamate dehydrogenase subunit D
MFDRASPIGTDYLIGTFGNLANGPGVSLTESQFGYLGELAAFPLSVEKIDKLVAQTSRKAKQAITFKIAANRWFVAGNTIIGDEFAAKLKPTDGSLIDLTHGRAALKVSGTKAEWVLSKLYPIDFTVQAFPVSTGLSTAHHNIFTQIHRSDEHTFDLFVFRSFARSFWHTLTRAADDVGYEVT